MTIFFFFLSLLVQLWDVRSGVCRQTFTGHESDINAVSVRNDLIWHSSCLCSEFVVQFSIYGTRRVGCIFSSLCVSHIIGLALRNSFLLKNWCALIRLSRLPLPLSFSPMDKHLPQVRMMLPVDCLTSEQTK